MKRNRDSFEERIDDDLFEFIISYLPIKDKLRYESVSKRFQRLVFSKQYVLRLSSSEDFFNKVLTKNDKINVLNLERLLKKFQFINAIENDIIWSNNTEVVETITQNCNHLTSVGFSLNSVEWNTLRKFCQKFGKQLKHISFPRNPSHNDCDQYLLKWSPNLLSFKQWNAQEFNELVFRRIISIEINLNLRYSEENKSITFAEKLKNVQYLSLVIYSNDRIKEYFTQLTEMKKLNALKIEVMNTIEKDEIWSQNFETIATNCVGLRHFAFVSILPNYMNTNECLQSISHCSGLKILKFCPHDANYINDLTPLKNYKSLLVLKLGVRGINDSTLDGIHLIVPQLKELSINSVFNLQISDKGMKYISKLKYLTHLRLSYSQLNITAKGLKFLIDSCERLKSVDISFCCITESYFGNKKRNFNKIIKHYQKNRKRVETRDEVKTKPLKCFWILWNRMKRWIRKSDTKQRSHCIQFDILIV